MEEAVIETAKDVDGEVVKEEEKASIKGLETRIEYGTARQEISQLEDFVVDKGEKLLRIDLACGQRKKEGFKGLDKYASAGVEYSHDLMVYPWPFEDNSVYEFNCSHYVEHIPIQLADGSYGLNRFMEEVWRCLMPKGTIDIQAPYYMSQECWQDPTHCFSDDTEILTKTGFKKITEVVIGEEVLTRDIKTGKTEVVPVVDTIFEAYKGQMLHFKTLNMDMLVTPNHSLLVGTNNKFYPNWRLCRADEMLQLKGHHSRKGIGTVEWKSIDDVEGFSIDRVPRSMLYKNNIYLPVEYNAEWFMRFIGWFLSEGSLNKGDNTYVITIHQSENINEFKHDLIFDVISQMGFNPQVSKDRISFSSKDMWTYLSQFGYSHEKYIPAELKECGVELLECLLDSLLMGDGTSNGDGWTYASVSKKLADDVHEIALKCGYRVTQSVEQREGKQWYIEGRSGEQRDIYLVYISPAAEMYYPKPDIIEYNGNIACVTVAKNSTIYVRRNGRGSWAGNCRAITDRTFMYYNQKTTDGMLDHYMPKCNFEIIFQKKIIDPSLETKGEQAVRWAIEHYWNTVKEVQFVLRKVPLLIKEEKV